MRAGVREGEAGGAAEVGAVEDEIQVDRARGVARGAAASQARLDRLERVEQFLWAQMRVTEDDCVQKFRRWRVDRLRLDDRADSNDRDHAPQLIDGATQIPAPIAEIGSERDDDGATRR